MRKIFLDFIYWLLMERQGWTVEYKIPKEVKRYVLLSVPHTSNWDAIRGMLYFYKTKVPAKFTIKKNWLKFPIKNLLEGLGAMGIDREKGKIGNTNTIKAMINMFKDNNDFILAFTPEGTRKPVKRWKTGFYHVALEAKVPIAIGVTDYKNKVCSINALIYPTGSLENDMRLILSYYNKSQAKFPEKFELDERYCK